MSLTIDISAAVNVSAGLGRYARSLVEALLPYEQPQVFSRFFRASTATQRAIPGTGLGLGIAKAIVDAHGGAIEVESQEGIGTTFRIHLPVDRPRERTRPREQAVA